MIKSEKIEFSSDWGNSVLACPRCGAAEMHQYRIAVFDRPEDATSAFVTVCEAGRSTSSVEESDKSGNPSSRRQGLAIRFRCEGCTDERDEDDVIELTLAQHKGATLLEWRFTERST